MLSARGSEVVIVRLGLLLSLAGPLGTLAQLASRGLAIDLAKAQIPVIDPDDAAALLAGLAQHPELTGVVHGVGPEPLMGPALQALLAPLSPLPGRVRVPRQLAERMIGPLAELVYNPVRVVPQRLIDGGANFAFIDAASRTAQLIADLRTARAPLASRMRDVLRRPPTPAK